MTSGLWHQFVPQDEQTWNSSEYSKINQGAFSQALQRSSACLQLLSWFCWFELYGVHSVLSSHYEDACACASSSGQLVSADGEPVLDEAEVTLLIKLREAKDHYRQKYEELLSTKAEVQYCRHLVDQCRIRLFTGNLLTELRESVIQVVTGIYYYYLLTHWFCLWYMWQSLRAGTTSPSFYQMRFCPSSETGDWLDQVWSLWTKLWLWLVTLQKLFFLLLNWTNECIVIAVENVVSGILLYAVWLFSKAFQTSWIHFP